MAVKISHKPYKHTSSGEAVRAIRVTSGNFKNVAQWCNGLAVSKESKEGEITRQRVRLKGLMAQVGDFIVRVQKGVDDNNKPVWHFFRVKQLDFLDEFKSA